MVVKISKEDVAVIYACLRTMLDCIESYLATVVNPYELDVDEFNCWVEANEQRRKIHTLLEVLTYSEGV